MGEVEKLEELEGETLSMRFLALAVSHTVSPSSRSRHTELTRRRSRSLEESLATIKRKKTCKTRKSVLRRSKLGESLVKMQQKTSLPTEVTSSKIIEETTTRSTLDSAKVFGRKFSASLDNFASLSLRESRVEEEEEVATQRLSGLAINGKERRPPCKRNTCNRWPVALRPGWAWRMSLLMIWQATWKTPTSSRSGCPAWPR